MSWITSSLAKDPAISGLVATPLIQAMIVDLTRVNSCLQTSPGKCQRWALYLGSEISLMTMIALLGVPPEMLGYGSHLGFQLNWNNGKPEIHLSLNHRSLQVPGCPGHCSLDQWLMVLQRALPESSEELCSRGGFWGSNIVFPTLIPRWAPQMIDN